MPSKSSSNKTSSSSSSSSCGCRCFSLRNLSILAIFLAIFSAVYSYLDARLDQFYIFNPEHLHDLSQRAIKAHGNDTRSVVGYIVAELEEKVGAQYLSQEEEWVFNNAGGAMGAMYIIHASTYSFFSRTMAQILAAPVYGNPAQWLLPTPSTMDPDSIS